MSGGGARPLHQLLTVCALLVFGIAKKSEELTIPMSSMCFTANTALSPDAKSSAPPLLHVKHIIVFLSRLNASVSSVINRTVSAATGKLLEAVYTSFPGSASQGMAWLLYHKRPYSPLSGF
jgi:hypothetical protein